jgi:hypothetical protein
MTPERAWRAIQEANSSAGPPAKNRVTGRR